MSRSRTNPSPWLALLFLAGVAASLPQSASGLDRASVPGPGRDPLAVQLGVVDAPSEERSPAARDVGRPPTYLFLRTPPDSLVAALMDSTSVDNMVETIAHLQNYGSRYVVLDSCWDAGYWISDQFEGYGYTDVRLDTFRTMSFQDSVDAMNVIAVKEGTTRPSEYIVIGGHYDSVSADSFEDPYAPAPGAEDNATAVAAVFEAARLLHDIPTDRSIMFACWSAEEEGLWGSRHFVASAVEESLDIVVYLNMDCIGYLEPSPEEPPVTVYTDSLSLAIAGYMQALAGEHTDYDIQTRVQPIGASDHTSFWEARYNVVDTGTTVSSPYRHTDQDIIDNIDPEFARAIAAVNVTTTAAVAGVVGEEPNLPPETVRLASCASASSPITMRPTFEWYGVDFDGEVELFEYAVESDGVPGEWVPLPAHQSSLTLEGLGEGEHIFRIRAIDDGGATDPTPATYEFTTDASLRPSLVVDVNFQPRLSEFLGRQAETCAPPFFVYEGERLVFTLSADASSYCGEADSVSVAIADSADWSDWKRLPYEFVLRPGPADTAVFVRTRDENGAVTSGRISLRTVPAPMDRPLLHVDDWFTGGIPEAAHDAFYEAVLDGESCDVWDPFEHIENYLPTLPPMDELGRYRTVIWTLDQAGGLLRPAQAESAYHYLEGFVRAGGNVILEGQSSLSALGAIDQYTNELTFRAGDFIFDHAGIDSLRNAGVNSNPLNPENYGYAFLGGTGTAPHGLPDVPVDTLGTWAEGYGTYGGLPYCEIVRPNAGTSALYRFDSYLNYTLEGHPCATVRFPDDGTGSFAWFGFPFYYLQSAPAGHMLGEILLAIERWQEAAVLSHFVSDATASSVTLTWSLDSPAGPLGCTVERTDADHPYDYRALHDDQLLPFGGLDYRYIDDSVELETTYLYRVIVTEAWGGATTHGPWEVSVPGAPASPWLDNPRPNPFRRSLSIRYGVATSHGRTSVAVYDVAGRLVKTLHEGPAQTGGREVTWDGTNLRGERVGSGVYFIRARLGQESLTRKVVLLN